MQKTKDLTLQLAGTFALAIFVGTSSFAEARHLGGTRGGGSSHPSSHPSFGRGIVSRPHFSSGFGRSAPRMPSAPRVAPRAPYAGRSVAPRGPSNYYGRGGRVAPTYRGGSFYNRGGSFYNSGSRFYGRGRIDRVVPYRGGYRVYLGGWGYPFFVPYRFYDPFRFRLGLFIGFNAFYDPLGYYSVYGWPYYGYPPPAYAGSRYYRDDYRDDYRNEGSVVAGTVESIDLHTGTVIIIEDRSNRRTTALLPPRDRRVDDIRVGDYIELSGSWVRGRNYDFDADQLSQLEPKR